MQSPPTEQTSKNPVKKNSRLKWFAAACCLGLLLQMFLKSQFPPKEYAVTLKHAYMTHTEGERAVMRRLSEMVQESPHSSRYVIYWWLQGDTMSGYAPYMAIYERNKKTFAHYMGHEVQDINLVWRASDVTIEDIRSIAAPGDYDRLRERVRRLRAQKKQQ